MSARTGPTPAARDPSVGVEASNGQGHDENAAPSSYESVTYILALLKPLVEQAQAQEFQLLTYLLEMAVLEASELEFKLKPVVEPATTT